MSRKQLPARSKKVVSTGSAIHPRVLLFLFLLVATTFFLWMFMSGNARDTKAATPEQRPVITRPAGITR